MILTSLKSPFIQKVVPLFFSQKSVVFKALQQDTFTLSDKERQKQEVETLLSKKRKFNISSYKKLSSSDIEKINETIVSRTHSAGERSVDIALDLKDYLDKTYGANNYVFCCIGTSPAGVARVFEFMGVETKYLPISGLTHVCDFEYYRNLYPDYLAFLSEQGLTKEKMEKSKKNSKKIRSYCVFKKIKILNIENVVRRTTLFKFSKMSYGFRGGLGKSTVKWHGKEGVRMSRCCGALFCNTDAFHIM